MKRILLTWTSVLVLAAATTACSDWWDRHGRSGSGAAGSTIDRNNTDDGSTASPRTPSTTPR